LLIAPRTDRLTDSLHFAFPLCFEEFAIEETVVLSRDASGTLAQSAIVLPDSIKLKRFRQEFRTRFCEGLLAVAF
jgi:putative ATP-dependent endonuclease of OLD family